MRFIPALLLSLFWLSAFAEEKKEIVMGFNPAENVDAIEVNGKAFSDFIHRETGLSVKTFVATDYTALVEALRSGRVDFAWLPPFSMIKAEEIAGAKVLLKAVRNGKSHFYSCIITRTDKGFKTLEDLKGKNIAWVDPSSASGHIIPKASLIQKKKIDPDKFFSKQVFAGGHDALVFAVLNGTVEAGATFCNNPDGTDGAWDLFLKGKDKDIKKIKVVHVTDPIPGETMATTKQFEAQNPKVVEKTVRAILAMGKSPEGRKVLTVLYKIDKMIKAESKDYDTVRAAAKLANVAK